MTCFCGCPELPVHMHHVVTRQAIKAARPQNLRAALTDERNLVPVALRCHGNHHARVRPYKLSMLPDSVFEFAAEVLGPNKAFNYLGRFYAGTDERLDALLGLPVEREGRRDAA